jgi:hypothetical protein
MVLSRIFFLREPSWAFGRPPSDIFFFFPSSFFSQEAKRGESRPQGFTGVLIKNGIAVSMDGRGAWRDNVFVERLWRSVKYEEVYLRA